MKIKFLITKSDRKEFIILGIIALSCLLYIAFRSQGDLKYALPTFPSISSDEFTSLAIIPPEGETFRINKVDGTWRISDGYPASSTSVERLLEVLEKISPVDLVSESAKYDRYELDGNHRHTLMGYNGDNPIREIHFGKLSSSGNYNYVLFPGNKNVYTLRGSLISTLKGGAESFRERTILKTNRNTINEVSYAETGKDAISITKNNEGLWNDSDGNAWETEKMDEFLGRFASLRAEGFLSDSPEDDTQLAVITLKGEKIFTLTIHQKEDDTYPVRSSEYPFPTTIAEYTGDAIINTFTDTENKE